MAWVLHDVSDMFNRSEGYYTGKHYQFNQEQYAIFDTNPLKAYAYSTEKVAEAAARRLKFVNATLLVPVEIPMLERSVVLNKTKRKVSIQK